MLIHFDFASGQSARQPLDVSQFERKEDETDSVVDIHGTLWVQEVVRCSISNVFFKSSSHRLVHPKEFRDNWWWRWGIRKDRHGNVGCFVIRVNPDSCGGNSIQNWFLIDLYFSIWWAAAACVFYNSKIKTAKSIFLSVFNSPNAGILKGTVQCFWRIAGFRSARRRRQLLTLRTANLINNPQKLLPGQVVTSTFSTRWNKKK